MANKNWDDIPYVDNDCIRDEDEWNAMVTYVKHSAADTFTIYDDEASTNQIFKFTYSGVNSQMYGGNDAADILYLYSNSVNLSPYIKLTGGGDFECVLSPSDNFKIFDAATEALRVSYTVNLTTIEGSAGSGGDLLVKGSSANVYSKILIKGDAEIAYYTNNGFSHDFVEGSTHFLSLYEDGTDDIIEGKTTGNDLKIIGVEGIHNYFKAGEEFKLFDGAVEALKIAYAANVTNIYGGTNAGDALKFRCNQVDARPYIVFTGGGDVIFDTFNGMYIQEGGVSFLQLYESGTYDVIEGKTAGNDLKIEAVEGLHGYFKAGEEFKLFDGTEQALIVELNGTVTTLAGGADAGDRLKVKCNSSNGLPYINLFGNATIDNHVAAGNAFRVFDNITEALSVTYAANVTTVEGGAVTGDDLILKSNSIDTYSKILIEGAGAIRYYSDAGSYHAFYEGALKFLSLYEDGTDDVIEGNTENNDLYFKPNGTGLVKFGAYTASTITHTGYITMKDAGGTERLVMIGEV